MKELHIEPILLRNISLNNAFDSVFCDETLKKIHGPETKISTWENDKRIIRFSINIEKLPKEIKKFFCGSKLRITSKQTRNIIKDSKNNDMITINNRIKMHFIFADFFFIKPNFYLKNTNEGIYFGGIIEHSAVLPPPLNSIAEIFMKSQSEKEIREYKNIIQDIYINKYKNFL